MALRLTWCFMPSQPVRLYQGAKKQFLVEIRLWTVICIGFEAKLYAAWLITGKQDWNTEIFIKNQQRQNKHEEPN